MNERDERAMCNHADAGIHHTATITRQPASWPKRERPLLEHALPATARMIAMLPTKQHNLRPGAPAAGRICLGSTPPLVSERHTRERPVSSRDSPRACASWRRAPAARRPLRPPHPRCQPGWPWRCCSCCRRCCRCPGCWRSRVAPARRPWRSSSCCAASPLAAAQSAAAPAGWAPLRSAANGATAPAPAAAVAAHSLFTAHKPATGCSRPAAPRRTAVRLL